MCNLDCVSFSQWINKVKLLSYSAHGLAYNKKLSGARRVVCSYQAFWYGHSWQLNIFFYNWQNVNTTEIALKHTDATHSERNAFITDLWLLKCVLFLPVCVQHRCSFNTLCYYYVCPALYPSWTQSTERSGMLWLSSLKSWTEMPVQGLKLCTGLHTFLWVSWFLYLEGCGYVGVCKDHLNLCFKLIWSCLTCLHSIPCIRGTTCTCAAMTLT